MTHPTTHPADIGAIMWSLNTREVRFLINVCEGLGLGCVSREEDKARQRLRRIGLVHVVMNPRRWEPLPLGLAVRAALQEAGK